MKFLADMGISLRTVEWLRQLGHDVVHLRDRGLQKLPDDKIIDLAGTENRIILTTELTIGLAATLVISLQKRSAIASFTPHHH